LLSLNSPRLKEYLLDENMPITGEPSDVMEDDTNSVAALTLALLEGQKAKFRMYPAALIRACASRPPPFGMAWYGDQYRSVAIDPLWVALSLIANASRRGQDAQELWGLAARVSDQAMANRLKRHAYEEACHADTYISLLEATLPEMLNDDFRNMVTAVRPSYGSTRESAGSGGEATVSLELLDEIIVINLREIRTRIHQLLLRPIVRAHCPSNNLSRVDRLFGELLGNEGSHILYTARLLEDACHRGEYANVSKRMIERLAELNQKTMDENRVKVLGSYGGYYT
jgi:hypothetical protein